MEPELVDEGWTEITVSEIPVEATDFLDGVLVREPGRFGLAFCPGWRIQQRRGDMDGPALHPREKPPMTFGIQIVEKAD